MAEEDTAPWDAQASAFGALKSQWDDFLAQPGAGTALMQFGINMMQPPSFGDTPMSQIGRAIGSAGEAIGRREEMERKQMESEAKADLAMSRMETQRARLGEQGWKEEVARGELRRKTEKDLASEAHRGLQGDYFVLREYNKYRMAVDAQNARDQMRFDADIMKAPDAPRPTPRLPMSISEFRRLYGAPIKAGVPIDLGAEELERGVSPAPGAAGPTGPDPYEGRTATNPKTGEQMIRQGGKWVPVPKPAARVYNPNESVEGSAISHIPGLFRGSAIHRAFGGKPQEEE